MLTIFFFYIDIYVCFQWSLFPTGTAKPQTDRSKKLLLFVNPKSGPGKALQIYKKQVASVFGEAEIAHEVVVTERANHALDMVKSMDLNKYSGIVIVSGDGLLYEVLFYIFRHNFYT